MEKYREGLCVMGQPAWLVGYGVVMVCWLRVVSELNIYLTATGVLLWAATSEICWRDEKYPKK